MCAAVAQQCAHDSRKLSVKALKVAINKHLQAVNVDFVKCRLMIVLPLFFTFIFVYLLAGLLHIVNCVRVINIGGIGYGCMYVKWLIAYLVERRF